MIRKVFHIALGGIVTLVVVNAILDIVPSFKGYVYSPLKSLGIVGGGNS